MEGIEHKGFEHLPVVSDGTGESLAVARHIAHEVRRQIEYVKREYKVDAQEAVARATEHSDGYLQHIMGELPTQLSWYQLGILAEKDGALSSEKWAELKAQARAYLEGGQFAADKIDQEKPWDRALFLALRHSFSTDWGVRGAIEQNLVDQLAIAYIHMLRWTSALNNWMEWAGFEKGHKDGTLPRISADAAVQRAADMVERFNRLCLRTLRALRDLRRYSQPVFVANARQVSVGGQQVNVAPILQGSTAIKGYGP